MKNYFALVVLMFFTSGLLSQVSIDSVASTPDANAMLDIKSGTKGILIPRLNSTQRLGIIKPAIGLLVYDVDDQAFYYYKAEVGWVLLITSWDQDGLDLPFNISNVSSSNLFGITQAGTSSAGNFAINNAANSNTALKANHNGTGYAFSATHTGYGTAFYGTNSHPASTGPVAIFENQGIGSGIQISMLNPSNGARGIEVNQTGIGPGVYSYSQGGHGIWGITSSISSAGVIGNNDYGIAIAGSNRGGNGVGAIVGRNDSSGYGVQGYNTKQGIGVLGQAGVSAGTGVGGRFENVNAANTSDALQAATNGPGYAASFTNSNNSALCKGIQISTSSNTGGTALNIANGKVVASFVDPYVSNATIDDLHLIIRAAGNNVLSSTNIALGTIVYVTNFSGGAVTITNTTVGNFAIANGRANQFIYFGAGNWTPVQ